MRPVQRSETVGRRFDLELRQFLLENENISYTREGEYFHQLEVSMIFHSGLGTERHYTDGLPTGRTLKKSNGRVQRLMEMLAVNANQRDVGFSPGGAR